MSSLTFSEIEIQSLFGDEAAEFEDLDRLREYYVKTSVFDQFVTELPLRILVGHKGIGKSALFRIAMSEDADRGRLCALIKPDDVVGLGDDGNSFLEQIRNWKKGLTEILVTKRLSEKFSRGFRGFHAAAR
jgi:hypothetical protein